MNHLKIALILTLFSSTFFAACKKDDDNGGNSENACKVSNVQYFDSGQVIETGTYTYTGNQVSKIQFNDYNFTFEYTGNNVSKRNYFFSAGSSPEAYDQISYNSDNTVSKIETFSKSNTSSTYSSVYRLDFVYTGGKLSKVRYLDVTGGASDLLVENTYTYTGNNITSLSYVDYTDTTQGTINYTYDTNPNLFKKQNSQTYQIDFFFNPLLFDSQGSLLPMAFSENNVTKLENTQIDYVSDDKKNLKDLKIGGVVLASYSYSCQ
ncbi:hypothetical protein OCK74_07485 [Chitinophagaceae bacterium LB-8]|uniref:DUF4595 domain-containing protein n=1 Tax=Paraflavisolibacter caeni TaxID=2982496 RepID=A0A9X2XNK0_9BACT|nr:hypothetical protein [Paraflavisolibacter caeni]MCU7548953.1 hypothetical protein [Paraflavisolibacter caeni]